MIKAIIFDFDGVILESAKIKTEAFAKVVSNYPQAIAEEFVNYHMSHMGVSRHVKFKYFIEEILKEDYSEEKEKELADRFSDIVFEQVMKCRYVPGAREFLSDNYNKYDLFIASGTPEEEMREIVRKRDLDKFFVKVYGTPKKKTEIIELVQEEYKYRNDEMIFVGDANTDLNAANKKGLQFIGRRTSENEEYFKGIKYQIDDLRQIEEILRNN